MKRIDFQRLLDTIPEDAEIMVRDDDDRLTGDVMVLYMAVYQCKGDAYWISESWRPDETEQLVYSFWPKIDH